MVTAWQSTHAFWAIGEDADLDNSVVFYMNNEIRKLFLHLGDGFDTVTLCLLQMSIPSANTPQPVPYLLRLRSDRDKLNRLLVPMAQTSAFRTAKAAKTKAVICAAKASSKKEQKKRPSAKAKAKGKAKGQPSKGGGEDDSMLEMVQDAEGGWRKSNYCDDVLNVVCYTLEKVPSEEFQHDVIRHLMTCAFAFVLQGKLEAGHHTSVYRLSCLTPSTPIFFGSGNH